jgi:hypothetical protein
VRALPAGEDGSAVREGSAGQRLAEAFTVEEFEDKERPRIVLAHVVNGEDIRMAERSHSARFLLEATQAFGVGCKRWGARP